MTDKKKPFLTRAEHAQQKAGSGKFQLLNRLLNPLIGIVVALIIISLVVILNPQDDAEKPNDEQQAQLEEPQLEEPQSEEPAVVTEGDGVEEVPAQEETPQQEVESSQDDTIVTPLNDALVKEVHTNPNWQPYPTQQTGAHTSTFKKGHIDYEEKLAAIFSVTELTADASIIQSVRNNGNAKSAIAVVTSRDKTLKYRVSIEWIDEQGWKPVKLEVLK
jgi:hypothetical protein